jgi:hypothetical protein
MKQHTQEEIQGEREWMESQGFALEEAEIVGVKFSYYVMPKSLNPSLNYFVYQCANDGKGVFGIADSVPKEFRQYAVLHEVLESGMKEKGRCAQALEKELSCVPEGIRKQYTQMRRDFFTQLVPYAIEKKYSQDEIEEFKGSLGKLEQLVGGRQ